MTSNSIRSREADIKAGELEETKRHNRRKEELKGSEIKAKNISTGVGLLGKVIGTHNDPS